MKQGKLLMRTLPALVACAVSSHASASGFQLLEQNASGMGNAYAGSAAVAENASTVFYNPAGMTQLGGRNISMGLTAVKPSYKFSNGSSAFTGTTPTNWTGDGNDGGVLGYVPNGYFSMALDKDVYFGLGIGAPFGLKTEYDSPWIGAAQSLSFEVKTLNINPSIAYKASDTVSVGFGLDWQRLNAKYKRTAGTDTNYLGLGLNLTKVASTLDVTDDAWGWNAGVLFNISPVTKVGISYRSTMKYTATGTIALSNDGSAAGVATMNALNATKSGNAAASIKLPDTWIFSATHKYNDEWELLGDLSWTGWSSIPKIDVMFTSGGSAGTVAQTLDTNFRDTWRVALGANYQYNDTLKIKYGVAYDQTPVKGADTRLVSLPDNDRFWVSLGAQWLPSKGSTIDVGISRLFLKDASVNNDQTAKLRGLVNGTYSNNAWILGAQYSVSF